MYILVNDGHLHERTYTDNDHICAVYFKNPNYISIIDFVHSFMAIFFFAFTLGLKVAFTVIIFVIIIFIIFSLKVMYHPAINYEMPTHSFQQENFHKTTPVTEKTSDIIKFITSKGVAYSVVSEA